jgi:tetratricopeptide (TPR) repeat protein
MTNPEELWTNEQWRKDMPTYVYYLIIADPKNHWGEVMSLFAAAVWKQRASASEIMELLHLDEVHDVLSQEQNETVDLFRQQLWAIEQGDLQDGFQMFNRLCDMADLSSQAKGYALALRGECYRLTGPIEKALSDFTDALQYIPDDVFVLESRGATYFQMERYPEALADLNRAIALNPDDVFVLNIRGDTYFQMERYPEALADLNRAIALDEQDVFALTCRAATYWYAGRYLEAVDDYTHLIELLDHPSPYFLEAYNGRGQVYAEMGTYQKAIEDLNQAIKIGTGNDSVVVAYSRNGLALAYAGLRQYSRALREFEASIKGSPNNAWVYYNRALTYEWMNQFDKAISDYTTALSKNDPPLNPLKRERAEARIHELGESAGS